MDPKLEEIYRENSRYVYNVALGILRNKDEAEDVMQNVFIKLFDSFRAFRGEANIKIYLYRMTVNKSIDYIRFQSLHSKKNEEIEIPEAAKNTDSAKATLDSLLENLKDDLKIPVLLSEIGGFSYKEIASILRINLGTVKSRINRGITRLKELAAKEA
ncbi:MAG: RNA polymerase sigma factor [Candidatus Goldiibacteriota bacterium]